MWKEWGPGGWSLSEGMRVSGVNRVTSDADGVGLYGGSCTCPDGQTYAAGDNHDDCASLACDGGVAGACSRRSGEWSHVHVDCATGVLPPPAPPAPPAAPSGFERTEW